MMEGSFGCSFDLDDDILCAVNQVENDYIKRQTDKTTKNIKGNQCFDNASIHLQFFRYHCSFKQGIQLSKENSWQ